MQKAGFTEALETILANDSRYDREGYFFVRDALDFTIKQQKKGKGESPRHVSGPQLLDGLKQYALKEYGPMAISVLEYWGIRSCEDIGNIVFNLVQHEVFGKTSEDRIDDFRTGYDFFDAFVAPFLPERRTNRPADYPAENIR